MKFYVPHVPASFGPGGQLVCVCPSFPSDGQTALVELHSMEVNKSLAPECSLLPFARAWASPGTGGSCGEPGGEPLREE